VSGEEAPLKRALEALLLVADRPLTPEDVRELLAASAADVRRGFEELGREYDEAERGFRLKEIAGGYQLVTDPQLAGTVRSFVQSKDKKRLSQAGLETLSIVAPITRAEIEFIRGVNVDASLKTLLEKGLIRIAGRKEVPGRPLLYATTKDFLDHFGLGSLKELPKLAEFTEKDIALPEGFESRAPAEAAAPSEEPSDA
jgi:segregation and condensation protein B